MYGRSETEIAVFTFSRETIFSRARYGHKRRNTTAWYENRTKIYRADLHEERAARTGERSFSPEKTRKRRPKILVVRRSVCPFLNRHLQWYVLENPHPSLHPMLHPSIFPSHHPPLCMPLTAGTGSSTSISPGIRRGW